MGGMDRGGYGEHKYAMGCTGVACGVRGRESSEGHSKGRNNKMDGKEKKTTDPAKLSDEKKNRKMCIKGPWENRPTTPTKKALRAALSTMSTSGKVLHVQSLNTLRFI